MKRVFILMEYSNSWTAILETISTRELKFNIRSKGWDGKWECVFFCWLHPRIYHAGEEGGPKVEGEPEAWDSGRSIKASGRRSHSIITRIQDFVVLSLEQQRPSPMPTVTPLVTGHLLVDSLQAGAAAKSRWKQNPSVNWGSRPKGKRVAPVIHLNRVRHPFMCSQP